MVSCLSAQSRAALDGHPRLIQDFSMAAVYCSSMASGAISKKQSHFLESSSRPGPKSCGTDTRHPAASNDRLSVPSIARPSTARASRPAHVEYSASSIFMTLLN